MNPNPEKKIATSEDRQLFWTNIMWSEDQDIKVRIKASELLGKSEGDFLAKKPPAKNPEWDFTLSDIIDDEIESRSTKGGMTASPIGSFSPKVEMTASPILSRSEGMRDNHCQPNSVRH